MRGSPVEVSPNEREAFFTFGDDFAGFDGHFPGNPLLPGIAQIMAAVLTAAPGRDARLREIGRSKFLNMVRPGETMRVRVTTSAAGNAMKVSAECSTPNGPCAQLKLVLDI